MKKFLFDTWYGAFSVLCGTSALLYVVVDFGGLIPFDMSGEVGDYVRLTVLALVLISAVIFFIAWIVSLANRRWKRAFLQAVLGMAWTACAVFVFGFLFILAMAMSGPSTDHFADNLTIPPNVAANIIEPASACEGSLPFITADVYDDDFAKSVFSSLAKDGGDDATVTCDLSALASLVHGRRDELMAYLARHPGWWLHEDRGRLCATRRMRVKGIWNHPLHGYFSGYSRSQRQDEEFGAYDKSTRFQMRTTLGFPFSPFSPDKAAQHQVTSTVKADLREWGGSTSSSQNFTSSISFGDKDFCLEVFEQSTARERRITNAALSFLKAEFAAFKLPSDAALRGQEEFTLRDGMQPGIYNLTMRLNPGEPGVTYLRAYEVTQGTRLSEGRLYGSSNERIGWSQDSAEKFLYENEFTIYEGDWGKPYAARIEVWFRPDSGKPERKLTERVCKIEGWQR